VLALRTDGEDWPSPQANGFAGYQRQFVARFSGVSDCANIRPSGYFQYSRCYMIPQAECRGILTGESLSLRTFFLDSMTSSVVGTLQKKLLVSRRARILSTWFARLVPGGGCILDVGCGDGQVAAVLQSMRSDISIRGLDVLPRSEAYIPVEIFDGRQIPFGDRSFEWVLFSDVLHHTKDINLLLREACRVASQGVLIKDHYRKGFAAAARLRFMDWVGNARYAVALPYNYWTDIQWQTAWREVRLEPDRLVTDLGLYPSPIDYVFGAQLHFIALLRQYRSNAASS